MALEGGTFAVGESVQPLTPATTNSLLRDADPAIFHFVEFLAWGIDNYVGPRFTAEMAKHKLAPSPVASRITTDPLPFLLADRFKFPILAVWRSKDVWAPHSAMYDKSTATWNLSYVLPALTPVQQDALNPILRAVSSCVRHLLRYGADPGYLSGASVYELAGVAQAKLVEAVYGAFDSVAENATSFRAVNCTLNVVELERPVTDAYLPLTSTLVHVDNVSEEGTEQDVAVVDIEY